MPFKTYTTKDGLLNQKVDAIIRDDRGLLWIGTPFGVNWFDGNHFYEPPIPAKTGQLYITNFYKDRNGTIWVLTFYNGLYQFKENRFVNFLPDTSLLESNANSVFSMLQMTDSTYIVATDRNVYWFNRKVFSIFDKNNPLLNVQITSIARLADGTLLFGNSKGLYHYVLDRDTWLFKGMILQDHEVHQIFVDTGFFWVATNKGLLRYPNVQSAFLPAPVRMHSIVVSDINKDPHGNIWFTSEKMYKIQGNGLYGYGLENGLPDIPQKIFFDEEGILWIGSGLGLTKLTNESYRYEDLRKGPIHSMVIALAKDESGKLWLGNYVGVATKTAAGYRMFPYNSKDIGYVSWLYNTLSNELVAGTITGFYRIDKNKIIKKYDLKTTKAFEDETGGLWLGTEDGRLFYEKNNQLKEIELPNDIKEYIDALYKDKNGFLWIGYRASGIRKFRVSNHQLTFVKEYSLRNGFTDLRVRCSYPDNKGNIIFGTRTNGIFIFSIDDTAKIWHLNTSHGLSANWVRSIAVSEGALYLATNKGVDVLTGEYAKPDFMKIDLLEDGLFNGANVIFPDMNAIWIGTDGGIFEYFPEKDKKNLIPPRVYLTQLTINGKPDSSVFPYTIKNNTTLTLPYNQNIIAFEFAGIHLKEEKALRYRYMLEGQQSEWTIVTGRNFVTYNLRPGNYNFKVEAEAGNGVWSKTPASFKFIIHPPFWQTAWFITLCTILGVIIFYFLYKYRLKQVLKVEKLRSRISSDLHDDIGSTLSSISILSDMALQEQDKKQAQQMVSEIKDNSLMLMEKMDDIVWSINPKNDSLENLMMRIKRFACRLFEAKEIDYNITIDENVRHARLSMENRQHIYLILKEAINNIVKYSSASESSITVKFEKDFLKITIYDNGVGFDRKQAISGNGLLNMEQRAIMMKADLSISSGEGSGTQIILKTKIK